MMMSIKHIRTLYIKNIRLIESTQTLVFIFLYYIERIP